MKKNKITENELILAELGDELMRDRILLENQQVYLSKQLKQKTKMMKKYKSTPAKLDGGLYIIITTLRLKQNDLRLKKIYKELEKNGK